jgi:hypothetical protein
MTTITRAAPAAAIPAGGLADQARQLVRRIAVAVAAWRTERAVAELDEHLLRDIGMAGTRPFERPLPTELWR